MCIRGGVLCTLMAFCLVTQNECKMREKMLTDFLCKCSKRSFLNVSCCFSLCGSFPHLQNRETIELWRIESEKYSNTRSPQHEMNYKNNSTGCLSNNNFLRMDTINGLYFTVCVLMPQSVYCMCVCTPGYFTMCCVCTVISAEI